MVAGLEGEEASNSIHNHRVHESIILNHPITKFSCAVVLALLGLALQLYAIAAPGSATAKSAARVATLSITDGPTFSRRAHTPFSQTGQEILACKERMGEQIEMDDDASASLHHCQSPCPAHKVNLWIAQSGYLPDNSWRSLRERGPPVSHI